MIRTVQSFRIWQEVAFAKVGDLVVRLLSSFVTIAGLLRKNLIVRTLC